IVGRGHGKAFRIELAADPAKHGSMLVVTWIGDGADELGIARDAADILWRGRALARYDAGVSSARLRVVDGFKNNVMLPTIAEIVLVDETVFGQLQQVDEAGTALADHRHAVLVIRRPVARASMKELVQVAVGPTHRCLQRSMQIE